MTTRIAITHNGRIDDYVKSVRHTGAEPIVIETDAGSPEQVIQGVDGLVLTGGGDVDPTRYGELAHPTFEAAELGRDECEIALVRAAVAVDKPVLAICRGLQVLNVAFDGTLIQDIPDLVPGALGHFLPRPKDALAHTVRVNRQSKLFGLLASRIDASDDCRVNSRHHQAIGRLAAGFVVSATAADGVIEAIEHPGHRFCMAVQWHPENFWRTGEFQTLFDALAQAASVPNPKFR